MPDEQGMLMQQGSATMLVAPLAVIFSSSCPDLGRFKLGMKSTFHYNNGVRAFFAAGKAAFTFFVTGFCIPSLEGCHFLHGKVEVVCVDQADPPSPDEAISESGTAEESGTASEESGDPPVPTEPAHVALPCVSE
eukprot:3536949-Amphidinium_carterae.1